MEELKIINEQTVLGKDFKVYGTVESPLFLAKDVAEWIDYAYKDKSKGTRNVNMMLNAIDDDEKMKACLDSSGNNLATQVSYGGTRANTEMWFVTEEGLYEILMQSRKPIAKEFKKQVKVILKTLRQTGGYILDHDKMIDTYFSGVDSNSRILLKGLFQTIEVQQSQLTEQAPMVDFTKRVAASSDLINIGSMAKLLNDEDIKIGRNRLYKWLRDNNILMKGNVPYQSYIDNGYFVVKELAKDTPYGTKIYLSTYVTGKGQIYLTETLRKECCQVA